MGLRFLLFQLAFLLIIIGAFLIGALILPLKALFFGWPSIEQARDLIHKSTKFYISILKKLGLIEVKIKGLEHTKLDIGMILVANHPSLLDIVFFLSIFKNCSCMAKKNLLYFSPYSLIIRWAGYVASTGGSEIVEQANIELENKRPFIIFPEGTRKSQNSRQLAHENIKFRRGAAALALRSNAPIVPAIFKYDPPVLGRGRKWYDTPDRICNIEIEFFPAINFEKTKAPQWEQRREITRRLEDFFKGKGK